MAQENKWADLIEEVEILEAKQKKAEFVRAYKNSYKHVQTLYKQGGRNLSDLSISFLKRHYEKLTKSRGRDDRFSDEGFAIGCIDGLLQICHYQVLNPEVIDYIIKIYECVGLLSSSHFKKKLIHIIRKVDMNDESIKQAILKAIEKAKKSKPKVA